MSNEKSVTWKSQTEASAELARLNPNVNWTRHSLQKKGNGGTWPRVRSASGIYLYAVPSVSGMSFSKVPYPSPSDLGYPSDCVEYRNAIQAAAGTFKAGTFVEDAQGAVLAQMGTENTTLAVSAPAKDSYWFERDDDSQMIIANIPFLGRLLRVPYATDSMIHQAYSSDGSGMQIKELAHRLNWAPKVMEAYLRARGITHKSYPWPDHEIEAKSEQQLAYDMTVAKAERARQMADRAEINRIKTDAEVGRTFRALAQMFADLDIPTRPFAETREFPDSGFDVYLPMKDLHVGKRPYNVDSSYTLEEQESQIKASIDRIVARVIKTWGVPNRFILNTGDDQLNSNSTLQATLKGTPQGANSIGSFTEQALVLNRVKVHQIDRCLDTGSSVYDHYILSNHAPDAEFLVSKYLEAYYRSEPRVTVENRAETFKLITVGDIPILDLHGHGVKDEQLPSILARLAKPGMDLSKGLVFRGHTHSGKMIQQRVQEMESVGIQIYVVPSCGPVCNYEESHGWHLAEPVMTAYRIDHNRGCDGWLRVG